MPSPVVLKFESAVELYTSHVADCARCRAATLSSPHDRRRSQCPRGRRFANHVDYAREELDHELVLSLFADVTDDEALPVSLTWLGELRVARVDALVGGRE